MHDHILFASRVGVNMLGLLSACFCYLFGFFIDRLSTLSFIFLGLRRFFWIFVFLGWDGIGRDVI